MLIKLLANLFIIFTPYRAESETLVDKGVIGAWRAKLEPGITLSNPLCKGAGLAQKKNSAYKLCLPSSIVKNLEVSLSRGSIVLKGPGAIQGPVLFENDPPVILIGSMTIAKGGMSIKIKKSGGFEMTGAGGGAFEIQGLVLPLIATKPLILDEVELEFTSPEDATLELSASGQRAGVVLRVGSTVDGAITFTPSPPGPSIFPDNDFFSDFTGRFIGSSGDRKLVLKLKSGKQSVLKKMKNAD